MKLDFDLFEPHSLIRSGFAQTIAGSQFSGDTSLPNRLHHRVRVGPQSLLVALELPPQKPDSPLVLLAHGMGVLMMNHRGSGPGMGLSDRLWNGGVSDDLAQVIGYIAQLYPGRSIDVIGFSLSGNVLLKYLGEERQHPLRIRKALAVNPPIDLKISSHILSYSRGMVLFNHYYMKLIRREGEALAECFPQSFLPEKVRTIWDFDVTYTAPAAGFVDADDYYSKCSSKRFLNNIVTPTTLLCSEDDPFIPHSLFKSVHLSSAIQLHISVHGGHMGYISKELTPWGDHRWMDYVAVEWVCDEDDNGVENRKISTNSH